MNKNQIKRKDSFFLPLPFMCKNKLKKILSITLFAIVSPLAFAANPSNVSVTYEGCRNTGTITLPNASGKFICPDSAYTSGSLGKGWNELDLIPFRLTLKASNSAPTTQTYTLAIISDNIDGGVSAFDVMSVPVLNTTLSDSTCPITVGAQTTKSPGFTTGVDQSIYRLITVTQAKKTSCVYDFYGRLALNSLSFPQNTIKTNVTKEDFTTQGIGTNENSITTKDIIAQSLNKNLSAQQTLDYMWNIVKTGLPATISFGDVCVANAPQPQNVNITVTWTKLDATPGSITAVANIFATNPAARAINVSVIDTIYQDSTQSTVLGQQSFPATTVAANSYTLIATHTVVLPASAGNIGDFLNIVANASYTDTVTGVAISGQTTATAQSAIQVGTLLNNTASINDSEVITGDGLAFSVSTPDLGSFTSYTQGTSTPGPVVWSVDNQSGSNHVVFNKTVTLDGKRITTGTLSDVANLTGADGFTTTSGAFNVDVSSSASVKLTIEKSIPNLDGFDPSQKFAITFLITRGNDATYSKEETFEFVGGGATTKTVDLTGLVPDTYTVTETKCVFYDSSNVAHEPCGLVPGTNQQSVNLRVYEDNGNLIANCAGTASFTSTLQQSSLATLQIQKITDPTIDSNNPDYNWNFSLSGPLTGTLVVGANAGFVASNFALPAGNYTVTETEKSGWLLTNATPNNGTNTKVCSFSVNYPSDFGKTISCTFNDSQNGKVKVVKTVNGETLSDSQSFIFQLRQGASSTQKGTVLEQSSANGGNKGTINFATQLTPGTTYQLCEVVMPGWTSSLGTFIPGKFMPPDGKVVNKDVDNSIVCEDFQVTAAQVKSFAIDNVPPPGGKAMSIGFWKNWSSCSPGGTIAYVLDLTLDSFPIASGQMRHGTYIGNMYVNKWSLVNNCLIGYKLLNKQDLRSRNMSDDPLYNLAAQLLAAKLNIAAGSRNCYAVKQTISKAQQLLVKYQFNGKGDYRSKMTTIDIRLAKNLTTVLENYNNNISGVCQ